MTVANKQLLRLLESYRDGNEAEFHKAAESIIASELTANHHKFANELKQALGNGRGLKARRDDLVALPRDHRDGEQLMRLQRSTVDATKIVLTEETGTKIRRTLAEHRKRDRLASYGYQPKSKLLFWGGPGCGKTYTAYHLAYELGLPIGVVRLNALVSSFLGDTASYFLTRDRLPSGCVVVSFCSLDKTCIRRPNLWTAGVKRSQLLATLDQLRHTTPIKKGPDHAGDFARVANRGHCPFDFFHGYR